MFETSYFDRLQDYLASGCTEDITDEELDYYNVLYALIGVNRKYGKDSAVAFLRHEPFNLGLKRAREMYNEAVNLFFADDTIQNVAHRNMLYDNLMKAAQVTMTSATSSKDIEVYGDLLFKAWKIKQLDKPDPEQLEEPKEKAIKIYSLTSESVGIQQANRQLLAAQIDNIPDITEREKERLRRDARIVDVDFIDMLNDQEEKTKDIG